MDSKLLNIRLQSLLKQSNLTDKPQFLGFLSEEQAAYAGLVMASESGCMQFGGYAGAQRVFVGVFPNGVEPNEMRFPISAVTITFRNQDILSHRDFLGAILALGVKREAVGDILIEKGRAVMFATPPVAKLINEELHLVGRVGVKTKTGIFGELPETTAKSEMCFTVSSLRLDCVVSAICTVSRNTAAELINEKRVSINSVVCEKTTRAVRIGDKITVRGEGKFTLISTDGITKKGRLKITVEKYGGF